MLRPAAFLDRDGVINIDKGYVYKISDFEWTEGAVEAIRLLNEKNYYVFIVTNQSGISRGIFDENDVEKLHDYVNKKLSKKSAKIDEFFYSPYHPSDGSKKYIHLKNLRKPNTGMLEIADAKWNIDKSKSFLIGDKESDIQCARNFGIKGYLFKEKNLFNFLNSVNIYQKYL